MLLQKRKNKKKSIAATESRTQIHLKFTGRGGGWGAWGSQIPTIAFGMDEP